MFHHNQYFKITQQSKFQVIEAAIQLLTEDYNELDRAGSDEEATQIFIDRKAKTFFFCTPTGLRAVRRILKLNGLKEIQETSLEEICRWFNIPQKKEVKLKK
jgi:hypothetical protein